MNRPIHVFINNQYVFTTDKFSTCKQCKQLLTKKAHNCEILMVNNLANLQYQLRPTDQISCKYTV